MKTFLSVLAAGILAPILLFAGCTVMLSFSMAEGERETRKCMASGLSRSQCASARFKQSTDEFNDALNDLGRAMGK